MTGRDYAFPLRLEKRERERDCAFPLRLGKEGKSNIRRVPYGLRDTRMIFSVK